MTITLSIEPRVEAYLREQAARKGQEAEAVAQAILVKAAARDAAGEPNILLSDYGIGPAQAAELRASFASFAEEWEHPEMDVYNDYDAAKTRLEADPAYAGIAV